MNPLDPYSVWRVASSRNNLSRPSCADLVTPTAAMISRSVCFLFSQLCAVTGEQSSRTLLFRNAGRRVKKETALKANCSASEKHRNTMCCERKTQIKSVSVPSHTMWLIHAEARTPSSSTSAKEVVAVTIIVTVQAELHR